MTKITGVKPIRTRANGTWVIVKVTTDQPGLYGIGSASDHYRCGTMVAAIEQSITPLIVGRDADSIEDLWQTMYTSAYWRNDSILNTAMAGVDMALWDIMGKEAGMPVYRLLGGPARAAVPCYAHAVGGTLDELVDDVRRYQEGGWSVIRCQVGPYGGGGFIDSAHAIRPRNARPQERAFDDEQYIDNCVRMFAYLREKLGPAVKLTHDVHEHLRPHNAVTLAKLLEPFRLYFVEDILPPEQIAYFRHIKTQCTTPQAMGELFNSPHEWNPLISERLIDFIRVHVSQAGGLTPCPEALVVLLFSVTLRRVGYGLALLVAFSLGLASVLILIGIAMVQAAPLARRLTGQGRLLRRLPVLSAALVALLGVVLSVQALLSMRQ